ncbi:hypothetical protein Tco_0513561 [Tanacetum coccineum]
MPPRMRTRSAGRPAAESLGGERVYGLVEVGGVEDLVKERISKKRLKTKPKRQTGHRNGKAERQSQNPRTKP